MTQDIPLKLRCKMCGRDLSDPAKTIDDLPGIRLKMNVEKGQGVLWLSALYGSYNVESTLPIREGEIVTLSCPHCKMLLPESRTCDRCGAPLVFLSLHGNLGDVQVCRRKGCRNHVIEFSDFSKMQAFFDQYPDAIRKKKD